MKATLFFDTEELNYSNGKKLWHFTAYFRDEKHLRNFINYIKRTKGYTLDEVYY